MRKLNVRSNSAVLIPLDSVAQVEQKPSAVSLSHIGGSCLR